MRSIGRTFTVAFVAMSPWLAGAALAADGEILIDQQRALNGAITPGDEPGFPITISRSGRYKLVGSLAVPGSKDGFEITANGVTLDLNGYEVTGTDGKRGINSPLDAKGQPTSKRLTVMNGRIAGFNVAILTGDYAIVDNMRASGDGNNPIQVGDASRLSNSTLGKIKCGVACLVQGNSMGSVTMSGGTVLGNFMYGALGTVISGSTNGPVGYANNTIQSSEKTKFGENVHPMSPNCIGPKCE